MEESGLVLVLGCQQEVRASAFLSVSGKQPLMLSGAGSPPLATRRIVFPVDVGPGGLDRIRKHQSGRRRRFGKLRWHGGRCTWCLLVGHKVDNMNELMWQPADGSATASPFRCAASWYAALRFDISADLSTKNHSHRAIRDRVRHRNFSYCSGVNSSPRCSPALPSPHLCSFALPRSER